MARITLEGIIDQAEEINWKVISNKYTNLKAEMEFQCPQGHTVITSYEKWRKRPTCVTCIGEENKVSSGITNKEENARRILALDQGTNTTGYSVFENGNLIKYGTYKAKGQRDERINKMRLWVMQVVQEWEIDFVQFEDIQLQDKKENTSVEDGEHVPLTTYKVLAQLQGVLTNALYILDIPYAFVSPGVWREYNGITGRDRKEKKASGIGQVLKFYNITAEEDACEAILIGRYAVGKSKKEEMLSW